MQVAGPPSIARWRSIQDPDCQCGGGGLEQRCDSASAERATVGTAGAASWFAPVHYGTIRLATCGLAGRDMLLSAVEQDPLSTHLLFVLAYAYDGLGDHASALATLRRASEIDPSNPIMAWSRGAIQYWSLGAIDRALPELAESMRLDPHDPEVPALTALAWLDLGDPERAAKWVEAAMAVGPEHPMTRRACGIADSFFAAMSPQPGQSPGRRRGGRCPGASSRVWLFCGRCAWSPVPISPGCRTATSSSIRALLPAGPCSNRAVFGWR